MKILLRAADSRTASEFDRITGLICDHCGLRSADSDEQSASASMSAFTTIDVRTDGLLRRADLCPTCASASLLLLGKWPGAFRALGDCNSPNDFPRKYCFTVMDAKTDHPISFTSLLDEGCM